MRNTQQHQTFQNTLQVLAGSKGSLESSCNGLTRFRVTLESLQLATSLQAVKAMRFESAEGKKRLETAETTRERAIQDEELAKQIQEEEGDEF